MRSRRQQRSSAPSGQRQPLETAISGKESVRCDQIAVIRSRQRLRNWAVGPAEPMLGGDGISSEQIFEWRLQELLELQFQSQMYGNETALSELRYVDLNTVMNGCTTQQDLDSRYLFMRVNTDGQIECFLMEGWAPLAWAKQPSPSFSIPPPIPHPLPTNKKRKSRAHVLPAGALSLIPFGQDERVTWTKRIFSFIGKMRKVLGDRRLAFPWGGSIMDSVIGVYLTQNVSDTFSSKAFMNIAAKFPSPHPKSTCSDIVDWRRVIESPVSELSACIECRGMHNVLAMRIRKFLRQVEQGMVWKWWYEKQSQLRTPIPKDSIESLREYETCLVNQFEWEALCDRVFKALAQVQSDLNPACDPEWLGYVPGQLSLEWMRSLDCDVVTDLLTSNLEGFGEKSAACVTLLCFHWKSFPVDVNVSRICARLGWVPLKTAEKIEDLDLYAPELEVHKYLKARLSHFEFDTLYELHYLMITMGKVFCTKQNPRCSACPLRNKCEYALNGGKKFERSVSIKKPRRKKEEAELNAFATPVKTDARVKQEALKEALLYSSADTPSKERAEMQDHEYVPREGDIEDIGSVCRPLRPHDSVSSVHQKSCAYLKSLKAETSLERSEEEILRILKLIEDSRGMGETKIDHEDVEKVEQMDREVAIQILKLNPNETEEVARAQYKSFSRRIHPDKCAHPDAALAFSLLNQAYHTLTHSAQQSESSISSGPEEDTHTDSFAVSHLPLAIYTPLTFTRSRNILHAFRFEEASVLLPFLPQTIKNLSIREIFLLPDPRMPSSEQPDSDVFALFTARDVVNGRFPLNGTFFQTNELFLMDGPSFSIPRSCLSVSDPSQGVTIARVYFGTSVSRITLGMGTAEVTHLFNHSYVCVRNFNFDRRQATRLHTFLSP